MTHAVLTTALLRHCLLIIAIAKFKFVAGLATSYRVFINCNTNTRD